MLENKFSQTLTQFTVSMMNCLKLLPLPPKCLTMWFYLQFALEVLQNGGGYEPTHSTSIDTENGEPFPSVPLGLLSHVLDRHFANYGWFPPTLAFFLLQKPGKAKTKEQDLAEGELPADEAVVASAEVESQWGWRDLWSLLAELMTLAWSTSRRTTDQKPHHMQIFHTRVRRTPPKIRQQQHLCWSHCLYCSILQKCITGSKIVSFSPFPSWLVSFSSFVLFTPPSPTTPCNVVLFYPRVTFPFKNFKSFVSSSSSSSSPCPKILHSHFAHYYCLLHFSFNLSILFLFLWRIFGDNSNGTLTYTKDFLGKQIPQIRHISRKKLAIARFRQ